jgi:hypothetical protein
VFFGPHRGQSASIFLHTALGKGRPDGQKQPAFRML